jgi:hypothetical protein
MTTSLRNASDAYPTLPQTPPHTHTKTPTHPRQPHGCRYNDLALAAEHFDRARQFVDHLHTYTDPHTHVVPVDAPAGAGPSLHMLGDWCAALGVNGTGGPGVSFGARHVSGVFNTFYYIRTTEALLRAHAALGRPAAEAAVYEARLDDARSGFNYAYFDRIRGVYSDPAVAANMKNCSAGVREGQFDVAASEQNDATGFNIPLGDYVALRAPSGNAAVVQRDAKAARNFNSAVVERDARPIDGAVEHRATSGIPPCFGDEPLQTSLALAVTLGVAARPHVNDTVGVWRKLLADVVVTQGGRLTTGLIGTKCVHLTPSHLTNTRTHT